MTITKNNLRTILVQVLTLVIFSVIAFAVPFVKNGAFWVSYVFGVIAIAVQYHVMQVAFEHGEPVKSKFYGFPIARIGVVYLLVQLAISLVAMALAKWIPAWVPVVLDVVLLAVCAIGFIAAEAMREEVEKQDEKLKVEVKTIRDLQSKAASLVAQCSDAETAALLQKFSEAIRYSDPVSSDALEDVERELRACIDELQCAITEGDWEAVQTLCRKAEGVLCERNRLCKLNK